MVILNSMSRLKKNEAHKEIMEQNCFLFFHPPRIHTKKYQFSFQGVHLKNNGNLKIVDIFF